MMHCALASGRERVERGNREKGDCKCAMVNNLVHTSKDKDGLIYIYICIISNLIWEVCDSYFFFSCIIQTAPCGRGMMGVTLAMHTSNY